MDGYYIILFNSNELTEMNNKSQHYYLYRKMMIDTNKENVSIVIERNKKLTQRTVVNIYVSIKIESC